MSPGGVVHFTVRGPSPLAEQESDVFLPNITERLAIGCCVMMGAGAVVCVCVCVCMIKEG